MKIFYIMLFFTFMFAFFGRISKNKNEKPNITLSIFVITIIVCVAGLRSGIGDTYFYTILYNNVVNGTVAKGSYEQGFVFLLTLISKISTDPQVMIFVTSLITQGLNIWILRSYANLFELQIYMYITSGYFLTLMNGIRQGMAAAIVFASTKLIIKNNFKLYLLVVLIMSTFHTSALVMIPVYFIVRKEAWSKQIKVILGLTVVGMIIGEPFIEWIFAQFEGSRYEGYSTFQEGGANIFRIIIAAVPVVLAYIGRDKLKEGWPESDVFVNMSVINLIIMSLSLFNWIFARLGYYFQPYTFVLLPYIIDTLFDKKEKRLIYYLFIVCYFIFMYVEHVISLGIEYQSNFIKI